eukprot:scaffold77211_cov79-Phaeocystis_antarctica.AAC.3
MAEAVRVAARVRPAVQAGHEAAVQSEVSGAVDEVIDLAHKEARRLGQTVGHVRRRRRRGWGGRNRHAGEVDVADLLAEGEQDRTVGPGPGHSVRRGRVRGGVLALLNGVRLRDAVDLEAVCTKVAICKLIDDILVRLVGRES